MILDYDTADRLIALEVLDASTRVDRVDTVQLQVIAKPAARASRSGGMSWLPQAGAITHIAVRLGPARRPAGLAMEKSRSSRARS